MIQDFLSENRIETKKLIPQKLAPKLKNINKIRAQAFHNAIPDENTFSYYIKDFTELLDKKPQYLE